MTSAVYGWMPFPVVMMKYGTSCYYRTEIVARRVRRLSPTLQRALRRWACQEPDLLSNLPGLGYRRCKAIDGVNVRTTIDK